MASDEINRVLTEKETAVRLMKTLVEKYGYSSDEIVLEAIIPGKRRKRVDLVVYKSADKIVPFIVFEIKRKILYPSMADDAIFHLRDTEAEYVVLTDGIERICFRLVDGEVLEIPDIPKKGEEIERISKEQLKPARNLAYKFWKIMDMMRSKGFLVEEYVEEVNKLILCKVIDERKNSQILKFTVTPDEVKSLDDPVTQRVISSRIGSLFEDVKSRYPDLFDRNEKIQLDPIMLGHAISMLQSYSITKTPPDTIGTFYEEFISRSMRGAGGQYFTPKQIVDFIVKLVDPKKTETILDPACGSGGFILRSMVYVWDKIESSGKKLSEIEKAKLEYARNKLYAIEKNQSMFFTAKMNLLLHGDGHSNVFLANSLLDSDIPSEVQRVLAQGGFDIIMGKSPMGGYISQGDFSDKYILMKGKKKRRVESVFLDRCMQFLKPGGTLAVIVPEGILFSRSFTYLRKFLLRSAYVRAIISLPVGAFLRYGTSIKTNILIVEKLLRDQPNGDYNVFMAELRDVGYDNEAGSWSEDLSHLLLRYEDFKKGEKLVMSQEPKIFVIKSSELGLDWTVRRHDPTYWTMQKRIENRLLRLGGSIRNLESISHITKGVLVRSQELVDHPLDGGIPYIRIGDMQRGTVRELNLRYTRRGKIKASTKAFVRAGDILFSTRGTIGKVAIVPKAMDGAIVASQIAVIRVNRDVTDPNYLYLVLSSDFIKAQLDRLTTGSIIQYLSIRDLRRLKVPVPPLSEQRRIVKKIKRLERKECQLDSEKKTIQKQIAEILGGENL